MLLGFVFVFFLFWFLIFFFGFDLDFLGGLTSSRSHASVARTPALKEKVSNAPKGAQPTKECVLQSLFVRVQQICCPLVQGQVGSLFCFSGCMCFLNLPLGTESLVLFAFLA